MEGLLPMRQSIVVYFYIFSSRRGVGVRGLILSPSNPTWCNTVWLVQCKVWMHGEQYMEFIHFFFIVTHPVNYMTWPQTWQYSKIWYFATSILIRSFMRIANTYSSVCLRHSNVTAHCDVITCVQLIHSYTSHICESPISLQLQTGRPGIQN